MSDIEWFGRGFRDGRSGVFDPPIGGIENELLAYKHGHETGLTQAGFDRSASSGEKPRSARQDTTLGWWSNPLGAALITGGALLFGVVSLTLIDVFTPDYIDPARYVAALEGREVPHRPRAGSARSQETGDASRAGGDEIDLGAGRDGARSPQLDSSERAGATGAEGLVKVHRFDSSRNPGFAAFVSAHPDGTLDPNRLVDRARTYLQRTQCAFENGDVFVCSLIDAGERPWRLEWPVRPVMGPGGELFIVASRLDLERPEFASGGVAKAGRDGGYAGVAIVCPRAPEAAGEASSDCTRQQMRVAFNLSSEAALTRFPSLFRTIGYDWIARDRFPARPYDAETFAIAALYAITRIIAGQDGADPVELRAGDEVLFTREALGRWVSGPVAEQGIRVGNRSDYQLGMSRGACALAASPDREISVEPAAFTPDLPSMPRSIRLGDGPSVPCAMFINWRIQQLDDELRDQIFAAERGFPDGYFSGRLRYHAPPGEFDAQIRQRALALRGTALTLYMLGFETEYSASDQRVVGQWPRSAITENRN